jgi:uncharacterized membrane protein
VDVARGVALGAMAIYHLGWDLSFLQLIVLDVPASRPWAVAAHLIAGSFLFLTGVSLVLAHGSGIRPEAVRRRLLVVGGAALAVTAATLIAFPESFIFFGVLHCIAVSSLLALPFLRLPAWGTATAGAVALALPFAARSPFFDPPWLVWTGLGERVPTTNDWVPLLPWFGVVLSGVAAAKIARPWLEGLSVWRPGASLTRALAWAGRHSLPIYLIHQPVLLGALMAVVAVTGPNPRAEVARFETDCTASCAVSRTDPGFCRRACGCIATRVTAAELWPSLRTTTPRPEVSARLHEITALCSRETSP